MGGENIHKMAWLDLVTNLWAKFCLTIRLKQWSERGKMEGQKQPFGEIGEISTKKLKKIKKINPH
jgi:hypothetical protein